MTALTNPDLITIIKRLKKYNPEKIILFGSWARGDQQEGSDVDLLVIKKTKTKPQDRFSEVAKYLPRDIAVDAIVYTPGELVEARKKNRLLIENILDEGREIYAKT